MKLIIAEKPELGRDIAQALLNTTTESEGRITKGDYTVTWAYGHLLELKEPDDINEKYKDWNEENLPIFFENWEKEPAKDIVDKNKRMIVNNKYKRDRLKLIGSLLLNADVVIHAGDPDEEGQNLIDEILEYFNYKGEVKRVFVNDNIEKNIHKAFSNLLDNKTQHPISDSAFARQMADKSFGINHSRLASIRLKKTGLSIGRVQTATLGLVVGRDDAISKHVKEKYYELCINSSLYNKENQFKEIIFKFKPSLETLDGDKRILNKEVLEQIKNALNETYDAVTDVKENRHFAPLPYNQTLLSADMNRLYGYSLKQTLDITQALRDKYKAITYNRSDSQYLKIEHFKEAPGVSKIVMENINQYYPLSFENMGSCFNDEYAPNHHGIIPQEKKIDISSFTQEEKNVYKAISERYLMQFLSPAITETSTTSFVIQQGTFTHKNSVLLEKGWREFFMGDEDEESKEQNGFIPEGKYEVSNINCEIYEKETKPLVKYTEGSLVTDMTSISKYVENKELRQALKDKDKGKKGENGSIGTVTTRGTIIETLFKRGYIIKEGKYIVSTSLGKDFYNLIPNEIKTAEVTAKWWLIQEEIKAGKLNVNSLMMEGVNEFNEIKNIAYLEGSLKSNTSEKVIVGKCPMCNEDVYEVQTSKGRMWICCADKKGCSFKLYEYAKRFKDIIKLNTSKVKKLLNGGTIEASITSKEGKPLPVYLKLKINNNYPNLEVDDYIKKTNKR